MNNMFLTVVDMSITAGYVILAVILIRLLLKKAPRKYSYLLWTVVAFRLVCPVSFQSTLCLIPDFFGSSLAKEFAFPNQEAAVTAGQAELADTLSAAGLAASNSDSQSTESSENFESFVRSKTGEANRAGLTVCEVIWIAGMILFLVYYLLSSLRLKIHLTGAIKTGKRIYQADNLRTPFVYGIVRPAIYLPNGLGEEERNYIIKHEQIHIRRKDYLVKAAASGMLCLHWFNPLVWAAFHLMVRDMEMSCDEAVLRSMGAGIKRSYCESLLATAGERYLPGGAPLAFGEGELESRIKNVLRYRKPAFLAAFSAAVLVMAAAVILAADPKESAGGEANTGEEEVSVSAVAAAVAGRVPVKEYDYPEQLISLIQFPTLRDSDEESQSGETDLYKIAEIEGSGIALYGIGTSGRKVLLQWGESAAEFDWSYMTPRSISPVLWQSDLEGDGVREVIAALYTGSGTGVSVFDLYAVKRNEDGTLTGYQLPEELYREILPSILAFEPGTDSYTVRAGNVSVTVPAEREEWKTCTGKLYTGELVSYELDPASGILRTVIEIEAETENPGMPYYPATLYADVQFENGRFTLNHFSLEADDE